MPYTGPSDQNLPGRIKRLPAPDRDKWVKVWNNAYRACSRKGDDDCEGHAFRVANAALKAAEPEGFDSVTIGLWPDAETASVLAVAGGEPAENLHLTLGFFGAADGLDQIARAHLIATAHEVAKRTSPLWGQVAGVGRFSAPEDQDARDVLWASVDVPGLEDLRTDLLQCLLASGLQASGQHGFTPHITLAYLERGADSPIDRLEPRPIQFGALTIALGADRIEIPLGGQYALLAPAPYGEVVVGSGPNDDRRLFVQLREFATPPVWMPLLPKPGPYQHPRYGEITLTRERNQTFARNFNRAVYQRQVPVDAEHETKLSGACGWITRLRQNDDGSVDARVDWTDRGRLLIEQDRFKYVSAEWYDEWQDPATEEQHRDVIVGAALTTKPFFKDNAGGTALRPLAANEDIPKEGAVPDLAAAPQGMTDDQAREFAEMKQTLTSQAAELAATKQALDGAQTALKQTAEELDRQRRDARRKRFTDEVLGRGDASGSRWVGPPERHVALLEHLADTLGEDSEQFGAYIEQNRSTAELVRKSELFREIGRPGAGSDAHTAAGRIEVKARALMATEPALTLAVAMARVAEQDPQLYAEYAAEQRRN